MAWREEAREVIIFAFHLCKYATNKGVSMMKEIFVTHVDIKFMNSNIV